MLDRTFFAFFQIPLKAFLFRILSYIVFLRRNSEIISSVFRFVKNFFQVFWFFQLFRFSGISWIPAVHRQLSMTALLGYHGVSSLSTLIFHYIDEKLIDKNWLTKRFTLGNLSLTSSNLTFSCFSRPNARITSIPPLLYPNTNNIRSICRQRQITDYPSEKQRKNQNYINKNPSFHEIFLSCLIFLIFFNLFIITKWHRKSHLLMQSGFSSAFNEGGDSEWLINYL